MKNVNRVQSATLGNQRWSSFDEGTWPMRRSGTKKNCWKSVNVFLLIHISHLRTPWLLVLAVEWLSDDQDPIASLSVFWRMFYNAGTATRIEMKLESSTWARERLSDDPEPIDSLLFSFDKGAVSQLPYRIGSSTVNTDGEMAFRRFGSFFFWWMVYNWGTDSRVVSKWDLKRW